MYMVGHDYIAHHVVTFAFQVVEPMVNNIIAVG
jgi:hypothetical protein